MRFSNIPVLTAAVILGIVPWAEAERQWEHKLTAVRYGDVRMEDGFWKHWQETNQRKLMPYVFKRLKETGHVDNFLKAAGQMDGQFRGEVYFDSDVYTLIEGAVYCLKLRPDQNLEEYIDEVIGKICSAQ